MACASLGSPPGGPERTEPPQVVAISPDSGAVNVDVDDAVMEFDAVIDDRGGGSALDNLVFVSPDGENARVRWRRRRVEIRPRGGFRPNTAYRVTLLPGVTDVNNNAMRSPTTIVFSTGATIPPYAVHGRVFDWMAERPAPNAFVEVVRVRDSLAYAAVADSTGQFEVGPLEPGGYRVRAFLDNNRNRTRDVTEMWDSVSALVTDESPFVELLAIARDTVPPRLLTASAPDSLTIVATFDRPLDPRVPVTPQSFSVKAADSSAVSVSTVRTRAEYNAARAAADSAARRDTAAAAARARPPFAPPVRPPQARPGRRAPGVEFVIGIDSAAPLKAGAAYRVTAVNARGLLGATRTSDRVVTVAPSDSVAAPVRRP